MGWGTSFNTEIYLSRQEYASVQDVKDKIIDLEDSIHTSERQILMFASSNVKDITPPDWEDEPIQYVHNEVSQILQMLKDEQEQLLYMRLYLETLEQTK